MSRRVTVGVAGLLLGACLLARAAERWDEENRERREDMEGLADAILLGHVAGEELAAVERYWATHLRRCPMDALVSAQYAVAELELRNGNAQAAVKALQQVLGGKPEGELRGTTQFNIAEIYRRHLRQVDKAVEHYRRVTGRYRHHARHYLLTMLAERGRATEAAKVLEDLIAQTDEKGEKLALLHRLATFYKQLGHPDQALAVYQRITREFTPDDIQAMRQAAAREARGLFERVLERRRRDDDEGIEDIEQAIHLRARDLRLGGRLDEFEAFRAEMRRGFQELERREREEDARERWEEDREREREREEPEEEGHGEREGRRPGADF